MEKKPYKLLKREKHVEMHIRLQCNANKIN